MNTRDKGYFSLDGVVDYKKFLSHFQTQAEGKDKPVLFHAPNSWAKTTKNSKPLVIVDLADSGGIKGGKSEKPKIEVVDPTEAERLRALGEMKREGKKTQNGVDNGIKGRPAGPKSHSVSGIGKGKKKRANKAYSKIKRAKDVFD